MKKVLLSTLALCCSLASLAQTTAPDTRRPDKVAKERKHEASSKQRTEDDDRADNQAAKPANHGQTVSTFAKTTALTGADKGAAVSAVARQDRSAARGERSARGGEHGHGGRAVGSGHVGSGHSAGGHHGSH